MARSDSAGMTARKPPPGKATMVARNQASCKRADRRAGAQKSEIEAIALLLAGGAHVLGAPGRAGAAHVMQFRTVGVERLVEECAPEGAEFGKRLFGTGMAGGGSGMGGRDDCGHDARPLFSPRLLPPWAHFAALKTSFGPIH